MRVKFIGGFMDGETIEESDNDLPVRRELWPVTDNQRRKRDETYEFCTIRDSQIYDLENEDTYSVKTNANHSKTIQRPEQR